MGEPQAGKDGATQDFERQIEAALEKIRPALQADGGDIELLRREVPGFGEVIDDTPDGGYGWRHDLMETY